VAPPRPGPTIDDVEEAAARLAAHAHRTPVLGSRVLDEELGVRLFCKCENLQRTGSFKFRGAYNALGRLTARERKAGVVAYSSGNHAQAVALAAAELGMPVTIVMPTDAPAGKVAATRGYGAQIVHYDRYREDREAVARAVAAEGDQVLVPPYDHPDIIAGQGTVARELLDQVDGLDSLYVPLGGGGLLAGTALSLRARAPHIRLVGVEPAAGDDGRQSLRAGHIVRIETPRTIADGAQTTHLGGYTFPIIRQLVDDIVTVTDDELVAGVRFFAERMKLVVEPTGCLGWAGAVAAAPRHAGERIGVVLSGGNVDAARLAGLLA
jgi:threonine dehydratase